MNEKQEKRYNELADTLKNLDESKKVFVLSLLKDFVFLEDQILELRKYPRYKINPKNPEQQVKLPVHEMLKDYQAQKNDIVVKILRTLQNEEIETSPLVKALARFSDND